MEDADGIRSATYTSDDRRWQLTFSFQNLRTRLASDHLMKVPHHGRVRMCSQNAAQKIMRGADVSDPITHGLVDGVFQRARSGIHATDLSSEKPHAEHVELLPAHVFSPHVDYAFETQKSADRSGGDSV